MPSHTWRFQLPCPTLSGLVSQDPYLSMAFGDTKKYLCLINQCISEVKVIDPQMSEYSRQHSPAAMNGRTRHGFGEKQGEDRCGSLKNGLPAEKS